MKELVSNNRFPEHPKQIKGIRFGLLSPQEITELSELEVCNRELYQHSTFTYPSLQDPSTNSHSNTVPTTPMPYGCLDRRLGISDKTSICETCTQRLSDCVGHFGHIPLALPVFHIGYFKAILTILQCICKSCSSLLLSPSEQRYSMLKRLRNPSLDSLQRASILKRIHTICKSINSCPSCGSFNGTVKKVGALKIIHEKYTSDSKKYRKKDKVSIGIRKQEVTTFRESFQHVISAIPELSHLISKAQEDLDPIKCYYLFENISDEDCELLGIDPLSSRPEQFIWKTLPVPPACIRPSVEQDNGSNEDDITIKLTEIIYTNIVIRDALQKGSPTNMIMEDWDFLQLQCAMYIHSELPGVPSSIAASSYNSSSGKPVRGFCQRLKGKAGRFRGNLSGKRVDFSSRTVISPDPNLQIGQVGVPVYIAQILTYPERVSQFNIQKLQQFIRNGPDMHPGANFVQQASTGFKKSLKYGNRDKIANEIKIGDIVERHMMDGDIVLFNRQPSLHKLSIMAHSVKVQPWRTFRLNECECLPYNADFDGDEMNLHLPQTEEARAESLILMSVQENLITPRHGQLVIAAIQDFITNAFLLSSKDVLMTRNEFCQLISYFALHDDNKISSISLPMPSIIKPKRLWTGKQLFSVLINFSVNTAGSKIGTSRIQLENRTRIFDSYSSKLSSPLLCPKDGYLVVQNGQLLLGRLDKGSIGGDGGKHSLLYIILQEYGPKAATKAMTCLSRLSSRWIGKRGFSIGLDDVQPNIQLREMRKQLIEQGYKICDDKISKYLQGSIAFSEYIIPGCTMEQSLEAILGRVLSKIREDVGQLCIENLGSKNAPLLMQWCGSKGSKINVSQMVACVGQQIIGGSRIPDGFFDRSLPHFVPNAKTPAAKGFVQNSFYSGLSPTEFFFHAMSGREGLVDTAVKTAETGYMQRRLMKALEDLSVHYDNTVRNSVGGIVQFQYGDDGLDPSHMESNNMDDGGPVNFERLWIQMSLNDKSSMDIDIDIIISIEEYLKEFLQTDLVREIPSAFIDSIKRFLEHQKIPKIPSLLFPPITRKKLDWFLKSCIEKYIRARIEPGTAVGALGAQSIGEPGTQMTLKTFHFAGVAGMNVTLGVPRIKEIINANKKIHTPIITAPLDLNDDTNNVIETMKICKARIERTLIEDVASCIEIIFPSGTELPYLVIHIDKDMLRKRYLGLTIQDICERLAMIFNVKSSSKEYKLEDIRAVPDGIQCGLSHPGAELYEDGNKKLSSYYDRLMQYKRILPKVILQGISTVQRVVINQEKDREKGYHLLVEGTGLQKVMTTEGIDGLNTTSNHMMDVQQVLGIEAARSTIINEIQYTMSKHGMMIDVRHVTLLADIMTFKGEILGITRFGISKMKDSVLMLASFEKTTEHLFDAAYHGKVDNISGVSECIIMGTPMPLGTGLFQMMFQQGIDSTKMTSSNSSTWLFDDK